MRIDYLGLEAFVCIAERGSFQRAAEGLNLSQTALSHRIRKIEEDLGVQLLVRTTREVSLTKAGQELLPRVRTLLRELSEAYAAVHEVGRRKQERVDFACLPTIANSLLPGILRDFTATRPDVKIGLYDAPIHRVAELVQAGDVEFGITILFANQCDLEIRRLFDEPYVLLVPRDHPLARNDGVTRADLIGMPMARLMTQSKNRQLVDNGLGEYHDQIMWRYEVQNATAAMSLVAEGAALTILPRLAVKFSSRKIVPLSFTDVRLSRSLGVVTRRGVPLSDMARELLDSMETRLIALAETLPGSSRRAEDRVATAAASDALAG